MRRPAARRRGTSAKASPDLRESFYELNRFFNMAAYNPRRRASELTGDADQDRARDEGFLFWLGWVAHNTDSLFSTADASGPFRRVILLATCTTYQQILLEHGRRGAARSRTLLGVAEPARRPGLCPPS